MTDSNFAGPCTDDILKTIRSNPYLSTTSG